MRASGCKYADNWVGSMRSGIVLKFSKTLYCPCREVLSLHLTHPSPGVQGTVGSQGMYSGMVACAAKLLVLPFSIVYGSIVYLTLILYIQLSFARGPEGTQGIYNCITLIKIKACMLCLCCCS